MSKTWNEEKTKELTDIVGEDTPVTQETVSEASEVLEVTVRSIGSKLRNMGYEVESAAEANKSPWNEADEVELQAFLEENEGVYTYSELSATFQNGKYTPKSMQGKVLSMEMTSYVKKAEKPVVAKVYSDAEEAQFIEMATSGASLEAIAEALGRKLNSVRGKALSLHQRIEGFEIPRQETSHAKNKTDAIEELGEAIADMSVEEIAEATGKTPRGIKTTLTRRKLSCANYDGAKRAERRARKEEAA